MAKKFTCKVCGQTFEADQMPDKCPICTAPSSEIEEVVEAGAASEAKPKKKGLDTNSNVYTIVYAAVMVIIVAFLLAFVSSALKPTQDANVENDTKGQILTALGYDKAAIDVQKTFVDNVKDNLLKDGELTAYDGAFLSSYGSAIKNGELHVFTAKTADGKNAFVFPVTGRGLWGGLWGYIAVDEFKTTVLGTYFYHESETAGLGARIGDRDFQEKFIGKPICDAAGKIALTVVKDGAAAAETEVDGVTGATLTSKGVGAMCTEGLNVYADFLTGSVASADCCAAKAAAGCCAEKAEGACCGKCKEGAEGQCAHAEAGCPNEGGCQKAEGCPKAEGCGHCPNANVEQ